MAVYSVDVAFASHFVALHHPVLVVLVMLVKNNVSKMAGNSASYPFNSWCIDRL